MRVIKGKLRKFSPDGTTSESPRPPLSLWRNRAYLLLWGGQVISDTGSGVSQIVYPLLVLAITRSPIQASLVGALRLLTYALTVLPAGVLLDRWDRKQAMIICDMGRALVLASVFVALALGRLSLVQLYITNFLEAFLGTFFDIATLSSLPQVVTKEQLPEALGRTQASAGVTNLIGPPLGGFIFALQTSLPFLIDAVSYMFSVCSLFLIHIPFQEQRDTHRRNLRVEMSEGLHWLWYQPLIRTMALLTSVTVFSNAGLTLIMIIAAQQYHATSTIIGLILGFGGASSILGALLAGRAHRHFSYTQVVIGALWLIALFWLPLAILPSLLFLCLIIALISFMIPFYSIANINRRLAMTPDTLQSRVNSVWRLISRSIAPLGLTLTGFLLQYWGPRLTILLFGGLQIVLALLATVNPHIRNADPLPK
jgi:predicted MFS family arabinose efflux permease